LQAQFLALLVLSGILIYGCNESNFSSSNGAKADSTAPSKEIDEPPTQPPEDDCVEGDKVNVNWSGDIKECIIDQGKTYNFDSNACTEMRKSEWECTWDNIKAEMKKLGLSSNVINKDSESGAKLVSCGQSQDGNRIVAQWVKLPSSGSVDCKAAKSPGNITTGCYTLYVDEQPPPKPTNIEEERKQVFDCMNSL
jgi:hypothetical protein